MTEFERIARAYVRANLEKKKQKQRRDRELKNCVNAVEGETCVAYRLRTERPTTVCPACAEADRAHDRFRSAASKAQGLLKRLENRLGDP